MILKMFKAKKDTNRFSKNQKVWIVSEYGNHLYIKHRWRGKGRYVNSILDKWNLTNVCKMNKIIGEQGLKDIEVETKFYNFITRNKR